MDDMITKSSSTIWLDLTDGVVVSSSNIKRHRSLCKLDPYLVTFRDLDNCLNYIEKLEKVGNIEMILFITNEPSAQSILDTDSCLERIEKLSLIDRVYILNSNNSTFNAEAVQVVTKTHVSYVNIESLGNKLNLPPNMRQRPPRERDTSIDFKVSSWSPRRDDPLAENSTNDLSSSETVNFAKRQRAEFMSTQFLRHILIEVESTMKEMIEFCRRIYADDAITLNAIREFEDWYDASNAIFWYTRPTFLYMLLNKALREQDIDTLYSIRYFIRDLHFQLTKRYNSQQNKFSDLCLPPIQTVYRGQLMHSQEFEEKIRYNIGGSFSLGSFLSTTLRRDLASVYAGDGSKRAEISVLFQIDIDSKGEDYPYANISEESAFEEAESEVLFTMGAVFQIESVNLTEENVWNVRLRLIAEEDEDLKFLWKHMKEYLKEKLHPLENVAQALLSMRILDKAEQFYLLLLQDSYFTEDLVKLSHVHNQLGNIYSETKNGEKAIEYYEKSVETDLKHLSANARSLEYKYSTLGTLYYFRGEFDKALSNYKKALSIDLDAAIPHQKKTALRYDNLGMAYDALKLYSEAVKMYEKVLEIRLNLLPSHNTSLIDVYNKLSGVHNSLCNYDKAIDYLNKKLEIQQSSLPQDHPDFAKTFSEISDSLQKRGKNGEAMDYLRRALAIRLNLLPSTDPSLYKIYQSLAEILLAEGKKQEALHYKEKAQQIVSKLRGTHDLTKSDSIESD